MVANVSTLRLDPARLDVLFSVPEQPIAAGDIPSLILGVATSAGVSRVQTYSGAADDGAITDQHVFTLASISKPLTALAIMRLAQAGRLVLNDPIARLLPEFDKPEQAAITPWHILTHTSGLPDLVWDELAATLPSAEALTAMALASVPRFTPGTKCSYNTLSFNLLSALIERVTDLPFIDVLHDEVLRPADASRIAFDPWSLDSPVATLHSLADGVPAQLAMRYFASMALPGAGLWGDMHSLLALGRVLLQDAREGEGRLLAPATLDFMTRLHTSGIRRDDDPALSPARFAIGWHKSTADGPSVLPGSPSVFDHSGAAGGLLWIDPEWDLVLVVLANRWGVPETTWRACVQALYGALRPV